MKNIQVYLAEKYSTSEYTKVEENIYRGKNQYYMGGGDWDKEEVYVTSLTFEQEPDLREGETPKYISQYPLEEILDIYGVWVTDDYNELNAESERTCYQEFGSTELENVKKLLEIVGKHVYGKKVYDNDLDEDELEQYKDMDEEELEGEGIIRYETVIE